MPGKENTQSAPTVLATDLDGTLIPLDGDAENVRDLKAIGELQSSGLHLVFVTGRHFDSVRQAIDEFDLPIPQWIICDVGTSIFQRTGDPNDRGPYHRNDAYQDHQAAITASLSQRDLRERLSSIKPLRLQETEKQGPFKLSYYADADQLDALQQQIQDAIDTDQMPYNLIASVDPFNGDGLIDLLPRGVSKAHAIAWWADHVGHSHQSIVFSGDSGNDYAALISGYRSVVVGNASRDLADRVSLAHQQHGWTDRLYLADAKATSGVLEGLQFFTK